MERLLLLQKSPQPQPPLSGVKGRFNDVNVSPPTGTSKVSYVENRILQGLNEYNPKLKLTGVIYEDLKTLLPHEKSSKFTGFIIERKVILQSQEDEYKGLGFTVWNDATQWYAMTILAYVFLTPAREGSRNILVAQTIFPELIDLMEKYINSPSYTLSNRPIYFINIINKVITANSILKPFVGIINSNINYVEAFPRTINPLVIPKNLQAFVNKYETGSRHHGVFSSDYYIVNFNSKELIIKTDRLVLGRSLIREGTYIDFRGSDEKFYWVEVLPVFLMALKEGYSINYDALNQFYTSNSTRFSARKVKKISRFLVLIKFMDKLTFK